MSPPPRSVLVICTRRIGDVLLVTPLLRSLARAWPDAAIDLLVFRGTEGIVAGNPDVRRVLTVPERPGRIEHLRFALGLWRRWDLAVSTLAGDRPTLYAWLAGRRRAGELVEAPDQRWKRRLLDVVVPFDNDATHTVAMHLALADALNVARVPEVVASWTDGDAQVVDALRAQHALAPGAYAVLHPSPKFRYKQWADAGWAALADHLVAARGLRVVLTGSPDADERALVGRVAAEARRRIGAADASPPDELDTDARAVGAAAMAAAAVAGEAGRDAIVDLSGALSLSQTTALIAGAALYVGPDTVTTHAAAATGVPTVALFGPSDPVKWGPWPRGWPGTDHPWPRVGSGMRGNVALVQGEVHDGRACVPCRLEGCDRHVGSASDCLTGLGVGRVVAAVEALVTVRIEQEPTVPSEIASNPLFGLWRDREDMADVAGWVRGLRQSSAADASDSSGQTSDDAPGPAA